MRNKLIFFLTFFFVYSSCEVDNKGLSIKPGAIWLDNNSVHINAHGGGILFHDNTYYWYGEHKIAGSAGNSAQVGVHVYISKDLYHWTDGGIALEVVKDDLQHDITQGSILERPKVIYNKKTGKFVMWFHLELKDMGYDAARSGVAISDDPQGPFNFVHSLRPNTGFWPINVMDYHKYPVADTIKEKYCGGLGCLPAHVDTINILGRDFEKGQMARDMNLFLDDDGVAYHLYSSEENSTLHISQLTEDYLSFSGKYARFFPNRYMEAPTIFKTSTGTYFFMGSDCTGWEPNAARSASAPDIWGPWTELGNPCVGPDSELTFHSQSTYILPVQGKKDAFIYMGDRWYPENPIDGTYIWLPIDIKSAKFEIRWIDEWNLDKFN